MPYTNAPKWGEAVLLILAIIIISGGSFVLIKGLHDLIYWLLGG